MTPPPPAKRARASPPASPRAQKVPRADAAQSVAPGSAADHHSAPPPPSTAALLLQSLTPSLCSWRLPPTQPLAASEQFLNEQLVHVAGAAALERSAVLRRLGLLPTDAAAAAGDTADHVCELRLVDSAWAAVSRQVAYTAAGKEKLQREKDAAERSVRDAMDLVSLLLFLREQEVARQGELSEQLRELETSLQRRTRELQTVDSELETSRQSLAQLEGLARAKELAFAAERRVAQTEKRALEVLVARLQGVETAFKAQLRRKDAEYERLRKHLQDAASRSSKEQRGIAVGKPLNGVAERRRTAQLAASHESHVTRQIVDSLERKKAELLEENGALATSYDALQRQLELLTSQYRKAAQLFLAKRAPDAQSDELRELTSVPLDAFAPTALLVPPKQLLPQFLASSMDALQSRLKRFEAAMRAELTRSSQCDRDEAIAVLQRKLAEAHEVIAEQDQLLQAALISQPVGSLAAASERTDDLARRLPPGLRSGGDAARVEQDAEDMALQQRELALKLAHVDEERALLREHATKLDQDRLEFEIEKQELVFTRLRTSSDDVAAVPPSSRSRRATQQRTTESDVHRIDAVLRVPVPASPATAALLRKMGIVPFDDDAEVP